MLKQGQIIKDNDGYKRKILATISESNVVLISCIDKFSQVAGWYTESELIEYGYTFPEEEWEPEEGMDYYFIDADGCIERNIWCDNSYNNSRKNFLDVYKTRELAESALKVIREKLGK